MYVYQQEDNTVATCSKQSSIPEGATWKEVESVPDRAFRSAWRITGDAVATDLPLAKEIAHELRRAKREKDFAPHDEVIMKQIPSQDATQAESDRVAIRDADAVVQTAIDACTDATELLDIHITEGL